MEHAIFVCMHILFVVFVWGFVIIAFMKRKFNDKIINLENKENWNRNRIRLLEKNLRDLKMDRSKR